MKGLEFYLIPWLIANATGLVILFIAYKWPGWGRILFSLLFGWACVQNYTTVHATPEVYLEYANMSVSFYSRFIEVWFSENITVMVTLISAGQGAIAIGFSHPVSIYRWRRASVQSQSGRPYKYPA